jgi:hypothetical protein
MLVKLQGAVQNEAGVGAFRTARCGPKQGQRNDDEAQARDNAIETIENLNS